ncbi:MAG: hypothetical protein ABI171_00205 [Collimonas sp.]
MKRRVEFEGILQIRYRLTHSAGMKADLQRAMDTEPRHEYPRKAE